MNNNLRIFLALIFIASTFISCSKNSDESLQELGGVIPNTASSDQDSTPVTGLFIISGNNQVGAPAQTFTEALKVQYLESGQPVAGKEVYFNLYSGGSVSFSQPSTVVTDSAGMASVYVTAGAGAGVAQIRATSVAETVDFSLTILSQSGNNISISSGNNQSSKVGTNVTNPLRVMVVDSGSGVPKTGILVRFEVLTGNGRISSSTNIVDVTSDASGVASVFFQTGTLAGDSTIRASIVSDPAQNVVFTATGTVVAGDEDLAQSEVSAASASLSADGASLVLLTMTAKDQYRNQIPVGGKTVTFTPNLGTLVGAVTDVGDGTYTQFLRAPSSIAGGPISIGATIDAAPLTSTNATVNLISGSVDLAQSEVVVSNPNITANGSSTSLVTVVLKDSLGNQLSAGGETVVISTANGTLLGSVVDNGNGTYSQMLQSTTFAQQNILLTATVGGSPVGNPGSINLNPGSADLSRSTITASDYVIAPDGVATTTITVVLKDMNGNSLLASAGSVVLSTTTGTLLGSVTDNADGSYQQSLRSSAAPGTATITGTLTGNGFSDTATVYFSSAGSGPSPVYSFVDIIGNNFLAANGSDTTTIKVTLKDNQNNQLSNGGSGVTITTSAGSMIGTITDNNDGTYTQVLRSSSTPTKNVVVSVVVDGVSLNDTEIVQFYGPLSLATSTVSSSPSAIEATGSTTSLLVLQAKDINGVNIPVGGETIALATDQGTLLASLVDNGNGTYTQDLQSTAGAQVATITATSSGSPLSDTATVEFFVANNEAGNSYDCTTISSINNKSLVVDGGELVLDTWNCEADAVFTNIILRNNASITHPATGGGATEYGLKITANSINIDASSSINVSGKGYRSSVNAQFRLPGPQQGTYSNSIAGGTHGGQGGGAAYGRTNLTYGNPFRPQHMGASGGACWNTTGSFAGGGRVKLIVTGDLVVNGTVEADGNIQNYSGNYFCGGAGGSVWIDAGALIGTGLIKANGGETTAGTNYRYGGGGGRVAVYANDFYQNFTLTNIKGNITAYGGNIPGTYDSAHAKGAAGTVFWKDKDELYGSMLIDNNNLITTSTTELNVPAPATPSVISSNTLTLVSAFSDAYDSSNPYVGYFVDPKVDQNATGTKFDNSFFEITSGSANNITISNGDLTALGSTSDNFEIFIPLNNFEITGNAELVSNANILVLKGDITSADNITAVVDGTPTSKIDYYNGNVLIDMTDSSQPFYGNYGLDQYNSDITFKGIPSLNISSTFKAKNVTLDSVAVVSEVDRGTNLFDITGTLRLQNSSSITQKQTETSEGGTEYSIEISAAGLYLEAGSSLSAIGKGYFANVNYSCRAVGNTHSKTSSNLNYYTVGGSHGGIGGYYEASTLGTRYDPMPSYGSFYEPKTSGGSCRYSQASTGVGGGIIYLDISGGPVVIDGSVSVDAIDGCMGAAGGSVYIKGAAVGGSGTISANGSNGNCGNVYAGGAGGRVAIHYDSLYGNFSLPSNIVSNISAFGGTYTVTRSSVSREASAGTIFIKKNSEQFGDMIINNNGQDGYGLYGGTFINIPGASTSVSLSSTILTNAGSYSELGYDTGFIKGLALNPNTAQNGTETIIDDTLFSISEAIGPTISVQSGDMTSIASFGDNIEFALVLKNIQISGKGQLKSNGKVLIQNGDLLSNDITTLEADGGIVYTSHVEFDGLMDMVLTGGDFHLYKPLSLTNLTIDSSTLTSYVKRKTNTINASGNISLSNSATMTAANAPTAIGEEVYSVEVSANNLTVDNTSSIDVTGKGYFQGLGTDYRCRVVGNQEVLSEAGNSINSNWHGAAHGGWASAHINNTETLNNTHKPYGSFTNPYDAGASCKRNDASKTGYGGGVVRLNISSTLSLAGTIKADGNLPNGIALYTKSGAGGSVFINTSVLNGVGGAISASSVNAYNAGSGGRIAIYYDSLADSFAYPNTIINSLSAFGGESTSGSSEHGSAGTIYLKDKAKTYGDLIVNNNNINLKTPTGPKRGAYINIPSGAISVSNLSATSAVVSVTGTEFGKQTNFMQGLTLNPNTAQNATTTYSDDSLFPILSTNGSTVTTTSDLTSIASNGNNARLMLVLNNLEILNKGRIDFNGPTFIREGDLSSADTTTFSLSNAGLNYGSEFEFLNVTTFSIDTVNLLNSPPLMSNSSMTITNSYIDTSAINITGSLTLDNTELVIKGDPSAPNLTVSGDLNLTNGSIVTHPRTYIGESDKKLYITANNMTIDVTSSINLEGKGYDSYGLAYEIVGPGALAYNTKTNGGSTSIRTASHGGDGSYSGTNEAYGSFAKPVELGAAESYPSGGNVRAGGGALRLDISNILEVNGTIKATGEPGGYGATGGSIWINTNTIDGTGSISANGSGSTSQGGGGGRIAVYFTTGLNNFSYPTGLTGSLSALGGGGGSKWASAGTIYLKQPTQTYGDMIINNGGNNSAAGSYTRFTIPGLNSSSSISSSTVNASSIFGYEMVQYSYNNYPIDNRFQGYCVQPNVGENGTASLVDNTFFRVTSSVDTQLILSGDPSSVASGGDTFRLGLCFDNLEVSGNGKLYMPGGDIYVLEGDLSNNDTSTFHQNGLIEANTMDVNGATWTTGSSAAGTITTQCAGNIGC